MSDIAWDKSYDHVTVTFDGSVVTAERVRDTITDTGFPATPAPAKP